VAYLKFVALALIASAVIARFIYVVVKTIRIAVLQVDAPMAGFDSEDVMEVRVCEAAEVEHVMDAAKDLVVL
jgi:hypothetical protein